MSRESKCLHSLSRAPKCLVFQGVSKSLRTSLSHQPAPPPPHKQKVAGSLWPSMIAVSVFASVCCTVLLFERASGVLEGQWCQWCSLYSVLYSVGVLEGQCWPPPRLVVRYKSVCMCLRVGTHSHAHTHIGTHLKGPPMSCWLRGVSGCLCACSSMCESDCSCIALGTRGNTPTQVATLQAHPPRLRHARLHTHIHTYTHTYTYIIHTHTTRRSTSRVANVLLTCC